MPVQDSAELGRILSIPRREWGSEQISLLVDRMTRAHKTPTGTQVLRPIQAVALAEALQHKGAFVPAPVGAGKTLISLLLPRMFRHIQRPMICLPAHLIAKTETEALQYRQHWVLPAFFKLQSYQALSRVSAADLLDRVQPDLIVFDESHYLKNPKAACTKRVARYLKKHPETVVVMMGGSPINLSIRDFAHLCDWAIKDLSPVPRTFLDLDEWSRALDADTPDHRKIGFGALYKLDSDDPIRGFRSRMHSCPGVVMTKDPPLPVPLTIKSHLSPSSLSMESAFKKLRNWVTPDDIEIADAPEVWRHAREIATGFYSVWVPRAPEYWRSARSAWAKACREILHGNRRDLDTEQQLIEYIDSTPGVYKAEKKLLDCWREIAPSFTPNPVPYWISDLVIDWICEWAKTPGLIWVDRPAVGERLAGRGLAYYGQDGVDRSTGLRTEQHPTSRSCVLARRANDSGRNLQAWRRNLVVDVPSRGSDWEQLIGRTHRPGQTGHVTVDVLFGCVEDIEAFWKAHARALRAEEMSGQAQKLCQSDLTQVLELGAAAPLEGPAWKKEKKE